MVYFQLSEPERPHAGREDGVRMEDTTKSLSGTNNQFWAGKSSLPVKFDEKLTMLASIHKSVKSISDLPF